MTRTTLYVLPILLLAIAACSTPTASNTVAGGGAGAAAATAGPVTWGQRYTWPDGLAVEVAAPVACKPSKSAAPSAGKRAVKVSVTMINGTGGQLDGSLLGMGTDAQFNGQKVDTITDIGGPCGVGFGSGVVLPGKTLTFDLAYGVDAQQGDLQLAFLPHLNSPQAVYAGKA
jgi:hypothetical protein